jgi:hypothetical protein
MKTNNGAFNKAFLIIIPIGVFLLCVVINYFMDVYYQKKLDNDTIDVLKYMITKDVTTNEYRDIAMEQFKEKGYTVNDETVSVLSTDEYVLLIKYEYIHDLKSFFNVFKVKWFESDGMIREGEINESVNRYTGMISSKYIVRLNEYREPVIEKFTGDEDELFRKELEKQEQTTTQVVTE